MKTMKKLIAISLTVVMLFALAVPAVAHIWYTEEQNTTGFIASEDKEIVINAGKLPEDVTVELGASDSDWKYAYPYILDRDFTGGQYNGAIDADVYVMYDETNIYIKEVRRDTIKAGDYSIYRFMLPGKTLTTDTKTLAGAYVQINFNAEATETATANTVSEANTLGYAWAADNTKTAGNYLGYTDFKADVVSLAVKEGDTFVVETAIPWAKIGDGTALDYDYIGFKHRVTTNGGTGSAYHHITSLANVGTNHAAGAKTYHNDWDNFAPMYLRTYVDENAANTKPDLSWYNETDTEFTITTAEQLRGLAYLVNQKATRDEAKAVTAGKTFKLGANIDLNPHWEESDGTAPYQLWLPIGIFAGTFDGQGYTIDDMICKPFYNISVMTGKSYDSWERNMGFIAHGFGNITIKNLTITDADIEATFCAAGLIAVVFDSAAKVNISNVYVDADVLSVPLKYTCSNNSHTHAASCYGHTNIFSGILMGRCLSSAENWATVENAVCLGNLAINKRAGTGATGSGPVWGTSASSSAKIDNVLVSLETNTINLVGIDLTTLKDTTTATGETYRTKYIANSGTWTETNSVNVASNGAMNNTAGAVSAYPESWVKVDEDSILEMPATVAEMISRNLWIQETAVDTATNTFSVRILTGIDTLEWDALGLKVEMKVGEADFVDISADVENVTSVYTTILAAGAEVNASALGGAKYVGGVVLTGISATETVTFKVTPIKHVGEIAYANAHASTVTYVNGVIQK